MISPLSLKWKRNPKFIYLDRRLHRDSRITESVTVYRMSTVVRYTFPFLCRTSPCICQPLPNLQALSYAWTQVCTAPGGGTITIAAGDFLAGPELFSGIAGQQKCNTNIRINNMDETGATPTSWGVWTRAWTVEENRHGNLLNRYLYLSGRVDMRQIEKTIQYLIGSGMDPRTENNPYPCFIYTSFQERETFISHGNTARHAKEKGDLKIAQIYGIIASDEKRHEMAYTKIMEKLFEIDPDGAVLSFADMMHKKIAMPAHLMYDGKDDNLFDNFSSVAQRLEVYTAKDYADILEFLVERWKVGDLTGLSGEGKKAQDYVCTLVPRIRRLDERVQSRAKKEKGR